jgi:hypothetical protein
MLGAIFIVGMAILARGALGEGVHLMNCWPWIADGVTVRFISIVVVELLSPQKFTKLKDLTVQ